MRTFACLALTAAVLACPSSAGARTVRWLTPKTDVNNRISSELST